MRAKTVVWSPSPPQHLFYGTYHVLRQLKRVAERMKP